MDFEAIMIGCGPAGLSAAIYLGRAKIKTLVLGNINQSQLKLAHNIENYFGFPRGISGKRLLLRGVEQAKKFGVEFIKGEVVGAKSLQDGLEIRTAKQKTYTAKTLLIATGTSFKLSGIQKEEELIGKGVHYCVECDGAFYKDSKIAVIGNGNHAAQDALDLSVFTKDITIISNNEQFIFSPEMKSAIEKHQIQLVNANVKEFTKNEFLKGVILEDGKELPLQGVFMACKPASALDFANELGVENKDNTLIVDKDNMTSVRGVFAAGNCAARCRQVAKNVGDGCNAALSIIRFLRNQEYYADYSTRYHD